ncbi:MAG: A/G-specific adenine glycosylase [Thermoplasmata archaeon]|jgi:A/G-specific adenine glycosylase|nr:A/G-specific adenine glycosylase [Thermoplasmata archaeon]
MKGLLPWYDAHARDLPWRRSRDPYAIWVSEVMLQQTRVEAVLPYYARWMARFPTVHALAQADLEEVLRLWSGLGYYRRARHLHAAARQAARDGLPADEHGWRQMPGIGPYAAGAIASIAHGERVPAVDGNVVRVATRVLGPPEASLARVREAAAAWVDPARPGDWNQALMDLGATVCTPRAPRCGECPVAGACATRQAGLDPAGIPAPRKRAAVRDEALHFAVVRRGDDILLVEGTGTLLEGLWRLPGGPRAEPLARLVREQAGVAVRWQGEPAEVRHEFTHRRWRMEVRAGTARDDTMALAPGARWVPRAELPGAPLSTAMRKAIAAQGL